MALGAHAALVGIGFFALGLPALLVLAGNPEIEATLRDGARDWPPWVAIGTLAVAAFYAIPLLWPLHLAVGLFEANRVGGVRRGDRRALETVGRALLAQAAVFLVIALALAVLLRGSPAFVVPLLCSGLHGALRRWLLRGPNEPR